MRNLTKKLVVALCLVSGVALADLWNIGGGGTGGGGSGTVTNVATTSPIGGGPITGSGTITCTTCTTSASALTANTILKGGGGQAVSLSAITDDGAGSVQMYPNSGTPQNVTFGIADAVGTDIGGSQFLIQGSQSTGAGLGGTIKFLNTNKSTTGTGANTFGNVLTLSPPNTGTTAPVNYVDIVNAITGSGPTIQSAGTDANPDLSLNTKGAGVLRFKVGASTMFLATSSYVEISVGTFKVGPSGNFVMTAPSSNVLQLGGADGTGSTPQVVQTNSVAAGNTDVAGGQLSVRGGLGTGAGVPGRLSITGGSILATGTTQHAVTDRALFNMEKVLTNNTVTAVTNATIANNTVVALQATYSCVVFNGTDLQVEEGEIVAHVTNKANVQANNTVVKYGNQQAATTGTLAVTWTITAASPAVLSVNCNSSLTPSTGYPKLRYNLQNLTDQAVSIQ